jgi:hypothetical protein
MSIDKIVAHVGTGASRDVEVGNRKLKIWGTKQESRFLRFEQAESPQSKFVSLALDDPLIRVIPFLEWKLGIARTSTEREYCAKKPKRPSNGGGSIFPNF